MPLAIGKNNAKAGVPCLGSGKTIRRYGGQREEKSLGRASEVADSQMHVRALRPRRQANNAAPTYPTPHAVLSTSRRGCGAPRKRRTHKEPAFYSGTVIRISTESLA